MDDGCKFGKGNYICTDSFTLNEHIFLVDILKSKFNLDCSYHRNKNSYRLYIFSSSRDKLVSLIKPYLISHFYYKLDLNSDSSPSR